MIDAISAQTLSHPDLEKFMKLIQRATLVMAGVLTLGLATTAYSQTVMRNSISVAQNSHQGVGIDVLAQEVEKGTKGRIIIKNFYSGSLGGERESIESVQLGTQELTGTSTGPVPNFVPAVRILDIPFLFRDKAHARAVLDPWTDQMT